MRAKETRRPAGDRLLPGNRPVNRLRRRGYVSPREARMEFRILGPLEVRDGDREVRAAGRQGTGAPGAPARQRQPHARARSRSSTSSGARTCPRRAPEDGADLRLAAAQGADAGDAAHAPARLRARAASTTQLDLHRFERARRGRRARRSTQGEPEQAAERFRAGARALARARARRVRVRAVRPVARARGSRSFAWTRSKDGSRPSSRSGITATSSASSRR